MLCFVSAFHFFFSEGDLETSGPPFKKNGLEETETHRGFERVQFNNLTGGEKDERKFEIGAATIRTEVKQQCWT